MSRYIYKRLLLMIPVVIMVAVLIFTIMYFTPGDPAIIILGPNASLEQLAAKRAELGIDQPYLVQLWNYLKNVFIRFDFGNSFINGRSVSSQIMERFPRTLMIAALSVLLSIVAGVPLGIVASVHQYTWKDNASMFAALIAASMPGFWIAQMMSLLFALKLGWLPATGIDSWKCYILPVVANAIGGIASMARRNALIPIVTCAGGAFGFQLGGALVVETVFSIPGLGKYMMDAINQRDYPSIRGTVIFLAIAFSIVMLAVDIMYAFIDPRIKGQYQSKKRGK